MNNLLISIIYLILSFSLTLFIYKKYGKYGLYSWICVLVIICNIQTVKLADIFTWDNTKTAFGNAWIWTLRLLRAVPWWSYVIASGIVIWNLPAGFLFLL